MLNYQTPAAFFQNCLYECGLSGNWPQGLTLAGLREDKRSRTEVVRLFEDLRAGADVNLARGKPVEADLDFAEWSRRWSNWANSRKAAFFSRAALFMLGDASYRSYFLDTLRNSHNIVFLGASSDVLQHATGHYLDGPIEDLSKTQLADWWEAQPSNQL